METSILSHTSNAYFSCGISYINTRNQKNSPFFINLCCFQNQLCTVRRTVFFQKLLCHKYKLCFSRTVRTQFVVHVQYYLVRYVGKLRSSLEICFHLRIVRFLCHLSLAFQHFRRYLNILRLYIASFYFVQSNVRKLFSCFGGNGICFILS